MTINKNLVKSWVKALRSGKYQQGRKALRNKDNKFCCLGVLCDISKKNLGIDWEPEEESDSFEIYIMERNGGVLPDKVWEYLGKDTIDYKVQISTANLKIPKSVIDSFLFPLTNIHLVTLNDHYKLSFDQIADILEEEFLNEDETTNLA